MGYCSVRLLMACRKYHGPAKKQSPQSKCATELINQSTYTRFPKYCVLFRAMLRVLAILSDAVTPDTDPGTRPSHVARNRVLGNDGNGTRILDRI